MGKGVPVYIATTWKDNGRRDHYRLYGFASASYEDKMSEMVFDGMDGITIDVDPPTNIKASWSDVENNPDHIESLVGPKGLAFLKALNRQGRTEDIVELHVVSAWQFSVLSSSGESTVELVLSAIRDHLSRVPVRFEWVLS